MELQKTENKLPAILQPLSKSELCKMLSSNNLAGVASILPSTLKNVVGQPPICDLERIVGRNQIVRYIEFELVKMSALVSVGGNLNDSQVQFIATQMVEMFPNESLADFKLCLQRGCIGQYGEIYRMDGIVIRKWMEQYLEEKYTVVEDHLMKEKEQFNKTYTAEEGKDWFKVWKESIDKLPGKMVPELTQEEIQREGKVKPVIEPYVRSEVERLNYANEMKIKMRECRRKFFLDAFPDATEEEVHAYWQKFPDTSD
jgi:hypothetical protein